MKIKRKKKRKSGSKISQSLVFVQRKHFKWIEKSQKNNPVNTFKHREGKCELTEKKAHFTHKTQHSKKIQPLSKTKEKTQIAQLR